jgi:lysophospholipase L1-like esterase
MRSFCLFGLLLLTAMTTCPADDAASTPARSTSFADFDARATAGTPLTVVFFGGSLTWGANASDPQKTSYRALMGNYLRLKYPKSSFNFVDASIGGTGSELGMFRLQRDVMAYHPDLVFLDFTANDGLDGSDPKSLGSYEGLLRDMISAGVPVEQAYFGFKFNFGKQYDLSKIPGYTKRRALVDAYQTACGDLYTYLQPKLVSGELNIDQLWALNGGKDGAHPDDPGYEVFFEAVRNGFEKAIQDKTTCVVPAKPVYSDEYHNRTRQILVDGTLPAGWQRTKTYRTSAWFDGLTSRWMGDVAMCDAKDKATIQPLKVDFTGTFVAVFGEKSEDSMDFKASIDGQPALNMENPKAPPAPFFPFNSKVMKGNLFGWHVISSSLPPGKHTLEIDPIFPVDAPAPAPVLGPNGKPLPAPRPLVHQLRIESICSAGD